uniref:Uncharacterized protein n=1 Tax=Spongospora subterranea TaxID=70186 RepID=A0A0H5RC64_9EUKA|eukprot:CRZ11810.1 hypothetical protein [Spongospora subterranea]
MLSISLIVSTMQLPNDEDSGFIMDRLKLLAGSSGAITVIRSDRLRIDLNNVSNLQVQALCQIIAGDPAVLYIEKRLKPKWMNRWTRGILNNGLTSSANYDTMTGLVRRPLLLIISLFLIR